METRAVLPAEPFTALLQAEELEERLEFFEAHWHCEGGGQRPFRWVRCYIHIIFSVSGGDGYDAESIDDTGVVDVPDGSYVTEDGSVVPDSDPIILEQQVP